MAYINRTQVIQIDKIVKPNISTLIILQPRQAVVVAGYHGYQSWLWISQSRSMFTLIAARLELKSRFTLQLLVGNQALTTNLETFEVHRRYWSMSSRFSVRVPLRSCFLQLLIEIRVFLMILSKELTTDNDQSRHKSPPVYIIYLNLKPWYDNPEFWVFCLLSIRTGCSPNQIRTIGASLYLQNNKSLYCRWKFSICWTNFMCILIWWKRYK